MRGQRSRSKLQCDSPSLKGIAQVVGGRREGRRFLHRGENGAVEQLIPGAARELDLEHLTGPTDENDHLSFQVQALLLGNGLRDVVVMLDLRFKLAEVALAFLGCRAAPPSLRSPSPSWNRLACQCG